MAKRTEWDYIVEVKLPVALKGIEPGKLHPSLLRDIPGGGKLFYLAADAWLAMVEAAKADGVELKPTSSGDLYRSYESQKAGFLQRYSLEDTGTGSTKTFEGKTWYLKKGMAKAFDFGCVWINTHIPIVAEMPHGGFKRSGYGKDLSSYGFEDYTRIKHVMTNLNA